MKNTRKPLLICMLILCSYGLANGQAMQKGQLIRDHSTVKIPDALIINRSEGQITTTRPDGTFDIAVVPGDTLSISCMGYISKDHIVKSMDSLTIYLEPTTITLDEVVINGQIARPDLKELAEDYSKSYGIYFKGKPPITLLSPFNGSPITFFYELLSKGGKRTRRLYKLAEEQSDFDQVNSRFNNQVIKQLVPIKDENLDKFKSAYWPTIEQIEQWTDYDLYRYIRDSFEHFQP